MNDSLISVVIRNKNEAGALENSLAILTKIYKEDINEIILVDNNSTDNSVLIAQKYNCKIVTIDNFSYGKATNLGIASSKSKYILLLSAHAIPVGNSFFKNTFEALRKSDKIAGIRYVNSVDNYNRAIENDFKVLSPLQYGIMSACAIINKEVWEKYKFNEELPAIEDKEWSDRVVKNGYVILDLNETYFYFMIRDHKQFLNRYKNETISEGQLLNKKFRSPSLSLACFIKKVFLTNVVQFFKIGWDDLLALKTEFEIYNKLNK